MAAENGQLEEVRYIHCLLCNDSKPFKGFLSHIREKHVNYYRYNCAKCAFKSDNEEDSALHSFEKNHHVKFDNANYHEYLAVKIFQDCCREQFVIRHRMEKHKNFVPKPTKRRRNWNSCSDIQKVQSPKKSKLKTNNNTCTSSLLKHEVDLQAISENQRNSGITTNPRKCLNDVEKPESGIHTTKILSKAAADDSESYKLSESDGQTLCALGLFSDALENAETTSSDKLLNANTVNNVVSIDGEVSKPNRNTFDPKRRTAENSSVPLVTTLKLNTTCRKCGKDVGVDYIAKKTHALQFHFTQDDDPEIAELLPATVKACFPYSLSWSDYQCTECGKALGTHGSRRNHVLKEHFYWSTICPLSGCTTVISAVGNLEEHFKLEHNISMSKMPKGLRQKLIKMKNDRKNDLHRQ
ncbi:zinc finger protein, partial [Wuchereria bancrofti]